MNIRDCLYRDSQVVVPDRDNSILNSPFVFYNENYELLGAFPCPYTAHDYIMRIPTCYLKLWELYRTKRGNEKTIPFYIDKREGPINLDKVTYTLLDRILSETSSNCLRKIIVRGRDVYYIGRGVILNGSLSPLSIEISTIDLERRTEKDRTLYLKSEVLFMRNSFEKIIVQQALLSTKNSLVPNGLPVEGLETEDIRRNLKIISGLRVLVPTASFKNQMRGLQTFLEEMFPINNNEV